ncbi:MAG: hypothetical protein ABL986_20135 [Vicinamibacterales bacterium]
MRKQRIALTREALYGEVWSEPIVHVATRLGLSGRGLGKLCARHEIPVPPRGWWAKKQHGHRVRQTPLPEISVKEQIVFEPRETVDKPEDPPAIAREKTTEWRIEAPEDLAISHPLVKRAAAAIRKASRESSKNRIVRWQDRYQAKLVKPGPGHLDIAVSKASVPRASRILQALLAAFERRGFAVRITEKNETFLTVLGEAFQIALVERLKQVTVKHTYGTGVDLEPSGRLMLRIGSIYHNAGVSDSATRRIENSLNRFVVNLVRRALETKRERAIHAERLERWAIQDEENRLAQQQRDSEALRRRRLRTAAIRWGRHQRNVDFVEAVERRLQDGAVSPDERGNAERWLAWASARLKAADPIGELLKDAWPSAPLRGSSPMPWNWE